MSRGWQSKEVAEQQALAMERALAQKPARDERQRRMDLLEMQRTRLLGELQKACAARMRGLIEQELAAINKRIAELK